jgi:hypothetical protein
VARARTTGSPAKAAAKAKAKVVAMAKASRPPRPTARRAGATPALSFAAGLESIVRNQAALSDHLIDLAQDVRATVAVKTLSGEPIQHQRGLLTRENFERFRPRPDAMDAAAERLRKLGLTVLRKGRFGISVSGPARLVRDICKTDLVVQARPRRPSERATQDFAASFAAPLPSDLYVAPRESLTLDSTVSEATDHFVFTPPPLYFAPPAADAPTVPFHHVDERAIRNVLNVPSGASGAGVRVAVIDTGFYKHPYYAKRKLDLVPTSTPSAPTPAVDDHGHGTAITFNVFAVAPRSQVLGFAQTMPPQDALEAASDAGAHVISCSWGWDREEIFPIVQATILDIIAENRIMLFAAGNGHYAWPGSQPEVISVGGVHWGPTQQLEASNYASGYQSSMFPGRRVPDVCGLCGQMPKGIYIVMPTQPGNQMDAELGGQTYPDKDETTKNDGWIGASGTSSATPQIAGIVALMIERARAKGIALDTTRARAILETTATPITTGRNRMGIPAVGHPNTATGYGLVNAEAAIAAV